MNVGVVLIIAIREISNHENEFDVNSRNIRPSKITRYTVLAPIKGVVDVGVVLSLKPILKSWQLCLSFKLDVLTT